MIESVLDQLSPALRAALILREMEGMAYGDIADMLDVPVGTVRSRLSNARAQFRELWLAANADAAHRFILAMNDAARWSNAHHADTAKILGPLANIDPATFALMARSRYTDAISADQLQPLLDVALTYGQLKSKVDAKAIVADAQPYWR